jgi:hypothetical protein
MSLYVVPATQRHARVLGPHLRAADAYECRVLAGLEPADALLLSIVVSTEAFTAKIGNVPVGMFGHRDCGNGIGMIWLVGSERMTADLRDFLSASSEWWERVTSRYEVCANRVTEANTLHRRWLGWMGCKFGPVYQAGSPLTPTRNFTFVRRILSRPGDRVNRGDHSSNRPAGEPSL